MPKGEMFLKPQTFKLLWSTRYVPTDKMIFFTLLSTKPKKIPLQFLNL